MTTIHISPQLADKLNRLAAREQKTVDEVLEKLLEPEKLEESSSTMPDNSPGGRALLKAVRKAHIHSGKTDTAERSREILDNEVAEAILEGQMMLPNLPDKPRLGSGAALLKSALEADIHAGDLAE
jgi:hypothetical protein